MGLIISTINDVKIATFQEPSLIDALAVQTAGQTLFQLVDGEAPRRIVLDFQHVRQLSSQMIGVLLQLHKKSGAINGKVVICGVRPPLMEAFRITKLDKVLEFAADETEAMGRFRAMG